MIGIAWGGASVFFRSIPWPIRRLGGLGFAVTASSLAGFLLSTMPADLWSARYLATIVWTAPFALAPAAYWLGVKRSALLFSPYLLSIIVAGWLGFGNYVTGFAPVRDPRGVALEELEVGRLLRSRGIHYAAAQYWLSYRLTFLFEEDPIVVPLASNEDRYAPYRRGFERAPVVAFIFHPSEPRATPEPFERQLQIGRARYERIQLHDFTILIHDRRPQP
jgi:hypothetical protein